MNIKGVVNISAKAWAGAILASLHKGVPGRQAPLLASIGASRTAFLQSLGYLIEIGLLERNPGHGHPLRPEYRLTDKGRQAARFAHDVQIVTPHEHADLLRKTWTLPILVSLQSPSYFNEISSTLQPITDRALSQSLKAMEARDWVQREVLGTQRPPRTLYRAVNAGAVISEISANAY